MALKIAETDRVAVLAAARETRLTDRGVTVELEGGGKLRVSMMTASQCSIMPTGPSSYTRTRSGSSRETLGVFLSVTAEGKVADDSKIASHVDVVIRRAYAAVAS